MSYEAPKTGARKTIAGWGKIARLYNNSWPAKGLMAIQTAAGYSVLLLLYLVFEGLGRTSEMGEHSNTIKGLLVIAALTWEITGSGGVRSSRSAAQAAVSRSRRNVFR